MVVGYEVVGRVEETPVILPTNVLDLGTQYLVRQALDSRPVAWHIMDLVVNYPVMTALIDPHTVPVANHVPAAVDMIVLNEVVMLHVPPCGSKADERDPTADRCTGSRFRRSRFPRHG